MSETLVRLGGAQDVVVDRLLETGIFKTKSEVIRAGILGLGKDYGVFNNIKDIEDGLAANKMKKISEEIKKGKRKVLSEKEVKKKYGFK